MKIAVVYYTGTGGTRLVASELHKAFAVIGFDSVIHQIHIRNEFSIKGRSHVAIAYPVHAGRSPGAVEKWASAQDFSGIDVSLFPVSGGGDIIPNTACRIPLKKIIKKNGGNIIYEDMFVMPANVFLNTPAKTAQALINILPQKAGRISEDIKNGTRKKARVIITDRLMAAIGALEHRGAKKFGRQLWADESCNLCGICVKNCPEGNIRIEGEKVIYNDKCGLCMGCVYICPRKSIHAKYLKFFILKDGIHFPKKGDMPLYKDCAEELRNILWIGVRRYLKLNM
ncbi:MAG: EFR1 family ferrodoxin [Clostridia bacterium]|nr:EFR1 family ferrodoxin [Clostridia bacterium]